MYLAFSFRHGINLLHSLRYLNCVTGFPMERTSCAKMSYAGLDAYDVVLENYPRGIAIRNLWKKIILR